MTTRELEHLPDAACVERVSGDIDSVYGPVEIAWYADHLRITALGAGSASLIDTYLSGEGRDVVFELRLPGLDELGEFVPGAD